MKNSSIVHALCRAPMAVLVGLSGTASAQRYAECSFDDTYWDASCPTQGFSAGCHRWHLIDEDAPIADINVCPVWDLGYTGSGVTIGVVDLGILLTQEDLVDKYNATASTDHCDSSGSHCLQHGTQIAGLMVAEANNEVGIVGVAYGATFAEIVVHGDCQWCNNNIARVPDDSELACALRFNNAMNDIKTISLFGGVAAVNANNATCAGYGSCQNTTDCVADAIEEAALAGRGGLGTVLVVSAGNAALDDGRTDYSRFTSHRRVIAVGGITHEDVHWCKADPGSSLFISAPSGDTDDCGAPGMNPPWELWSTHGYGGNDQYTSVVGTSYSTPLVGAVVALMLEADATEHGLESMSVRDVMHGLANTSRQVDDQNADWDLNNGVPPHNVHYDYGFGAVDAYAAVGYVIDAGWRRVLSERVIDSGMVDPDLTAPSNGTPVSWTFTVQPGIAGNHLRVEHVELVLNASIVDDMDRPTNDMGNLKVRLRGPDVGGHRTESLFADYRAGETATTYDDFVFTSVRHWDESAVGQWTVEFQNNSNAAIFIHGCHIRIYGTPWCRGDFNADGTADSYDLADFLTAYLSGETGTDGKPLADYDNVPGLEYPDDQDAFLADLAACEEP